MTKKANPEKRYYSEGILYAMLERRFEQPNREWALFPQVRSGAGFDAKRTADAVAMNMWPSRGLEIHGFEIKVTRSDWQRELTMPEKMEETMTYCDRIWIIAPEGIVEVNELPAGWGLMCPYQTKRMKEEELRVKVQGSKRSGEIAPKSDLSRSVVAAILKRAYESVPATKAIEEARKKGYETGHKDGESSRKWELNRLKEDLEECEKVIREFEKASGVTLRHKWEFEDIGQAVKVVIKTIERGADVDRVDRIAEDAERYAADVRARTEAIKSLLGKGNVAKTA